VGGVAVVEKGLKKQGSKPVRNKKGKYSHAGKIVLRIECLIDAMIITLYHRHKLILRRQLSVLNTKNRCIRTLFFCYQIAKYS
jgi:hypothetical protein